MPFYIVREDITKLSCDAIVNAADPTLLGGGGVDGAIHAAAGSQLLDECKSLGGCKTGEAKITKGYNLPAKHVIHTVGPIWQSGNSGEEQLLANCYANSLALAKQNNCETVAFPLISSGAYGYPAEQAMRVARSAITSFLQENEMTVYLVVFDKTSYAISQYLFDEVLEFVDDYYVYSKRKVRERCCREPELLHSLNYEEFDLCCAKAASVQSSLETMLSHLDDTFAVTLLKLIDAKGMQDTECYKKANVSRQTWYKIINERDYKPSKNTVLCFAIALKLTLEETKKLLATVGFALSRSSKFDVIIEYFLINKIYDIFLINETLFDFDQVCLGV